MKELIVGTRGSKLALSQTKLVIDALAQMIDLKMITKIVSTEGDRRQDLSLRRTTGEGVFVREIEGALLRGEIDLAVHSLKDLPIEETLGLRFGAFLKREDPREAFLSGRGVGFEELPEGSIVGTSSLRRIVQLQRLKTDYQYQDIRGNIDTRLQKMTSGQYQGIILAMAGLKRLQLTDQVTQIFSLAQCLPAAGQGVIAIQIRENLDNAFILKALHFLNDQDTESTITAERSFLKQLGGGCRLPVGALATIVDKSCLLFGMVSDTSGKKMLYHQATGNIDKATTVGIKLADWFLKKGIIDWK